MSLVADGNGFLRDTIEQVSRDKNIDKKVIIEALEQAMLHAARKGIGSDVDLEAVYNEELDDMEEEKLKQQSLESVLQTLKVSREDYEESFFYQPSH